MPSNKKPRPGSLRSSRNLNKGFTQVGTLLDDLVNKNGDLNLSKTYTRDKYISREFQKYGYDLAEALDDLKNKSLYIKLAKETPRALLEQAKNFVADAQNVKSKPKLFMWKLQQLKTTIINTNKPISTNSK